MHDELVEELVPAHEGAGPLLQRDYWAVIRHCRLTPSEVMFLVSRRFADFAPKRIAEFTALSTGRPLQVGDELEVKIALAGTFRVRVLHLDALSFTLGTLRGHPEAGRITFGAYRNAHDDVIFHIRSKARSSSKLRYLGFVSAGDAMQTETWVEFVNNVAVTTGEGVVGNVYADRVTIPDEPADPEALCTPTFTAKEA